MTKESLPESMRAWRAHAWGEDPTQALVLETIPLPDPGPGDLLVRVQAIPLNLNDLERVNGKNMMARPELPVTPGMEVMGVVAACGPGTEDRLGERVVAMPTRATGGFAEFAICPSVSAFEMPEAIPLPDAAALYFPFHLAWLGLFDRAKLQAKESVLIHAGAGGAGSAAIQLAKHRGAHVFATAGSAAKVALCKELGADVAIDYTSEDFKEVVLRETQNRGVDVVFDGVGEAVMDASMACVAYDGRYVMLGFASDKRHLDEPFIVPRRLSMGNFTLCGFVLAYADPGMVGVMKGATGWNLCPHSLGEEITAGIVDLVRAGTLHPVIGDVVAFEALPAALERMRDRKTTGRTIVRLS